MITHDAIIAVDEYCKGHLVQMLTNEQWKVEMVDAHDDLIEMIFDENPGLYYANMSCQMCGGDRCSSTYECTGDCAEVEWEIVGSLCDIGQEEESGLLGISKKELSEAFQKAIGLIIQHHEVSVCRGTWGKPCPVCIKDGLLDKLLHLYGRLKHD